LSFETHACACNNSNNSGRSFHQAGKNSYCKTNCLIPNKTSGNQLNKLRNHSLYSPPFTCTKKFKSLFLVHALHDLWSPYVIGHTIYIFILSSVLSSSFFFLSTPNLSGRRLDVCHTSKFHAWCGLSANLGCRSETCCTRLAGNAGRKKSPKSRHLRTIVRLCRAISLQLRHVSTIGKKLLKQQYFLQMSPQYGELWLTSGGDRSGSLGYPS